MQVILLSLVRGLPYLLNIFMIFLIIIIVFAIMGVDGLGGALPSIACRVPSSVRIAAATCRLA
jgi:hypothetical protein